MTSEDLGTGMEPDGTEGDVQGYNYWLNVALGAAIGSLAGPGGAYTGAVLAGAVQQPEAEALYRYGSRVGQRTITEFRRYRQ